jgi:excisionase family DNA binding protein
VPGASRSVTSRGVTDSRASPNVSPRSANHGQFAALVLHDFLSPRQAAQLLGVNRETIYRLCGRGVLPHVRVGSALRIDLTAYVARS